MILDQLIAFLQDTWIVFTIGITGAIVVIFSFIFFWKRLMFVMGMRRMYHDEILFRQFKERAETKRPEQEELAAALKIKKEQQLKLPNASFHYVDEDRIRNFYTDYFREPTVESMVGELVSEVSGEVKASFSQVLESRLGGTSLSKWISTIQLPETSLNGMFLKYMKETVRNNQVALDLELLDVELSDVDKFQKLVKELHNDLDFVMNQEEVENHIGRLKERAAERTLRKLETASGWAVVQGAFLISQEEGFYRYTYKHPVNNYIAIQDQSFTIEAAVPIDSIRPHVAGNYTQSVGSEIPVTIYGEVWQPVNRTSKMFTLTLTPLAIY